MFKKRVKNEAELNREREARISKASENLKVQILTMENKNNVLLSKVLEARRTGLKSQENQARGLLKKNMASLKQTRGMLMTLELAVQSRDLAALNRQFLECIGALSEDIQLSAGKSNAKKAENKYLKAMYVAQKQSEELDKMLEVGDYASMASVDGDKFSEFDGEIDSLIELAESGAMPNANIRKQKI